MNFALLKVISLGVLATIAAKIGIVIFYEIFPPKRLGHPDQVQAIKAAIIGLVFASPFLLALVKSIIPKKGKKPIKVNKENLNIKDSFFARVKELKRK
tara:strand:+ start:360 stop:653 length:294 start_codon:yes stop_codon:yes gene_type:complete